MRIGKWLAITGVLGWLVQAPVAFAFNGDPVNGKRLFMVKGSNGKSCMTCHPKGLTTGETYKGKDIPDLTERAFSEKKLRSKTTKFLKLQGMTLSDRELEDLLTFEATLPSQGFGPVPKEWESYVNSKVAS